MHTCNQGTALMVGALEHNYANTTAMIFGDAPAFEETSGPRCGTSR